LLDERLSFRDHINDKINKAFSMLGIIKRNFKHFTIQSFTMLYKKIPFILLFFRVVTIHEEGH